MKKPMMMVVTLVAASAFASVKDFPWCKVELPDSVTGGTRFQITVTPKKALPDGCNLSIHMHHTKGNGQWGGMYEWRPAQNVKTPGQPLTFTFNAKAGSNCKDLCPMLFVAPNGDFSKKLKEFEVNLGKIPYGGGAGGAPAAGGEKPARTAAAKSAGNYPAKPASVTFKKSFIWLEEAPKATRAGENLTLRIHYKLDPSDTWGDKPTQMMCMPLGPWIDNPDGKYNTKRMHVGYPGLGTQHKAVQTGDHVIEFTFKLGKTYRYNGCSFLCKFKQPNGADWPWEWRGGGMSVIKESETFFLEPTALGGLFKYGVTPEIKIGWGPRGSAAQSGKVTVRNVKGAVVLAKDVVCTPAAKEQTIRLDGLKERGLFSVTLDVDGVGSDYCYFGTIPEFQREGNRRTPFGITNIYDEEYAKIGAELGFSFTRLFTTWKELETDPGNWHLDGLDRTIALNDDNGLKPWICLYSPPSWSLPEGIWSAGFEPSPFDLRAWANAVTVLAKRYDGKLFGFEWLNEIVPGNKCKDPVKEYVAICKAGYQAAKAVNPKLVCQLAGGLWPHNYRIDCLNAGVGDWVDVLPVHYSTYDGIAEAKTDLRVRDIGKVRVADNETASGISTWEMPPAVVLEKSVSQCRHVMTRWPDELCAGSLFITYFGGGADPCGNWSYLLDKKSPRPVAVTLAVVQGKIGYAKAVGKFFIEGLPVQLFERDGKAIAFVTSPGRDGVTVTLPADRKVTVTDYLGNVTEAPGGKVTAGDMPVIVEGLDLDQMKLHAALKVGTSEIPAAEPQVIADAAEKIPVPVTVSNPYTAKRTFTVTASVAEWGRSEPVTLTLEPKASKLLELVYATSGKIPATSKLRVTIATKGLDPVDKPFMLYAIDPNSIGNLLTNGDFESGIKPWGGVKALATIPTPDNERNQAVEFKGTGGYQSMWQGADIPVPGQSYLYTCWMWTTDQEGGSNISERFSDGTKEKQYYMPAVFSIGAGGSASWRLMVKRFDTKPNTKGLGLTPVTRGKGICRVDNVSLSLYHGTDFAAFAGRVGGEKKGSKVPLLCDNQIRTEGGYAWKPESLAGVAEFSWDKSTLNFTCTVVDDVSSPKGVVSAEGDESLKGDMIALAIFPKMGADGMPESDQERWYLSLASPGGGSGKTTLFRPKRYSLGLKSGQLAKDSSVYQVNFRREGGKTVYDLKIPWSEIPGVTPAKGASFGCNLVLIDSDGGAGLGKMIWGADLSNSQSGCGIVTLLP